MHPVNGKRGLIPMPIDATFLNAIAAEQSSRRVVFPHRWHLRWLNPSSLATRVKR